MTEIPLNQIFLTDFLHRCQVPSDAEHLFFFGFSAWIFSMALSPQEIATALLRDDSISMPRGVGNWDFPSYRELPPTQT